MPTSSCTPAPPSAFSKAHACPRISPAPARNSTCRPWRWSTATASTARRASTWRRKRPGVRAHIGSEITCTNGLRYPLLAETREGYQNLCRLVTRMKLRAKKGEGAATLEELAEFARGLICITRHPDERLLDIFGQRTSLCRTAAPLPSRGRGPTTRPSSSARAGWASRWWPPTAPAYATPAQRELLDVFTCVRNKITLADAGRLLEAQRRAPRQIARRNGAPLRRSARSHRAHTPRYLRAPGIHAGRSGLRISALSRARGRDHDVVPAPARG